MSIGVEVEARDDGALVTVANAAKLVGVHPRTIRSWCAAGRLPSIRRTESGRHLLRLDDVRRLVDGGRSDRHSPRLVGHDELERRLLAELRAKQAELEHQLVSQRRLLEVNERLLTNLDPQGVLELIADSLREVVSYDNLTIYRLDKEQQTLLPVLARDRFAELIMGTSFPVDAGITGWVIRHAEAQMINAALSDPRTALIPGTPAEEEALIIVPLIMAGEVMGTLNLGRIGGPEIYFSDNDFELTKLFGAQASIALRNALAHRAMAVQAETDALTGLLNHGVFQRRLDELVASDGVEGSLLMLDLDRFKDFNDAHGHPSGDSLLQAIALALRSSVRETDSVYRYGGDEFAVLLPATATLPACEVAERVCRAVRSVTGDADSPVTISVGVATYPHDGRAKAELVQAADGALYRAKEAGGDRVAFRAGIRSVVGEGAGDSAHAPRGVGPKATVEQRLRLRNTHLNALYETTFSLLEPLEPSRLLENVLARAAELLATPHAYLYMVGVEANALEMRIGLGFFERFVGIRLGPGEGISGRVWVTGCPLAVGDYGSWEGRSSQYPDDLFRATVGVPLTSGGEVVGVLGLAYEQPGRTFDQDEVALLSRFAELASVALRNARLYDSVQRDLRDRRRVEDALRRSEARFRSLVQNSSDMIAILDADGSVRYLSPSVQRVLGYPPEELQKRGPFEFVHPDDSEGAMAALQQLLLQPGGTATVEFRHRHADGSWRYLEASGTNLLDDPDVAGIVINSRDVTERRSMEAELSHQVFYDSLTGLPNRALFMDRLEHALAKGGGQRDLLAVLLLDLDRFKVINESLGHAAGDRLLVEAGGRLEQCLRSGDTVARFGGDEFAILLDGVPDVSEASLVADRILSELGAPIALEGRDAFVTASIGIAANRRGRATAGEMIRDADIALYRAKADASSGYAVFDPRFSGAPIERLELENDLRRALDGNELELRYQPIVELVSGQITGVEALVRWRHPRRGLLEPTAFIGVAEETGLILPLGDWVLEKACRQAHLWQAIRPALAVSVNLSGRQFARPELATRVGRILAEAALDPGALELEITETVAMGDTGPAVAVLGALKELGVRLTIDDFGTGYSSLGYLKRLPVDALKVDRSFVTGLGHNDADESIVRTLIALGHGLGMQVIAEGIETSAQLDRLTALGCDRGQGFYFARPLTDEAIGRLIAGNGRRRPGKMRGPH